MSLMDLMIVLISCVTFIPMNGNVRFFFNILGMIVIALWVLVILGIGGSLNIRLH